MDKKRFECMFSEVFWASVIWFAKEHRIDLDWRVHSDMRETFKDLDPGFDCIIDEKTTDDHLKHLQKAALILPEDERLMSTRIIPTLRWWTVDRHYQCNDCGARMTYEVYRAAGYKCLCKSSKVICNAPCRSCHGYSNLAYFKTDYCSECEETWR